QPGLRSPSPRSSRGSRLALPGGDFSAACEEVPTLRTACSVWGTALARLDVSLTPGTRLAIEKDAWRFAAGSPAVFIGSSTIMNLRSDGFPARLLVTALALVWATAIGVFAASGRAPVQAPGGAAAASGVPAAVHATVPPQTSLPPAQASNFVGDETCTTCHESEGKSLRTTLHGKAQNARTPAARSGQSCETCHGPGQAHVDTGDKTKIKRFTAMSAKDVNATCLTCHSKGSHAQWNGGMHDARNLSCATCHSVHTPKSERAQLKTVTAVQTCATCHKQESMKVQKSGHMPVREGKMDCTTCHT